MLQARKRMLLCRFAAVCLCIATPQACNHYASRFASGHAVSPGDERADLPRELPGICHDRVSGIHIFAGLCIVVRSG